MSGPALLLDSFDLRCDAPASRATATDQAAADARDSDELAAYENGYRSGWDDCLAAERETAERIGAELARNLADLGFTYHEARTQMLAETEAFLGALFRTVLPSVVGAAVARLVVDDLSDMLSSALDVPIEVVVCPADAGVLDRLLREATTIPVQLVEEPALAEGQAYLRFGQSERAYDLSGISGRLCDALVSGAKSTTSEDLRSAG